jgi:hypothetical protein
MASEIGDGIWAIAELMGHRRLGGFVREVELAGAKMLRIDVPGEGDKQTTQFYGANALFCLTPTTEEIARSVARGAQPAPVHRFELLPPVRSDREAPIGASDGTYDDNELEA